MSNGDHVSPRGVSPASTGPAGPHFEAQVAASYLLALLTGAEPRGLPGTIIDLVELQRASEGRPLDDVIVHAHDASGIGAILQIQVKREITFAPSDGVFADVVRQIAAAANRPDFSTSRYQLAIATAKISRKIAGPYQEVLRWSRQLGSAATFVDRINRPGSSSADMRSFVATFRTRLQQAGAPNDDETVWCLLRRLQILAFDFTAEGSADESLARERAARALQADDAAHAGTLWTVLIELALRVAASAGDRTRAELIEDLRGQPFRLVGERRHAAARARLAEAADNALADISDSVGGATLMRHGPLAQIRAALDTGRYVEVRGDSGVGKSALLKHLAREVAAESRILVFSPTRTIPRGWSAMQSMLSFDGTARELVLDLATTGGAIVFVDNVDRFAADERLTVIDLVRAAAEVGSVAVVVTARTNFDVDEPSWLPADTLDRLGRAAPVVISELSEEEVEELRHTAPVLVPLLADDHPARPVARNLFRLARLTARRDVGEAPRTEIDMAQQWWHTADGTDDILRRDGARALRLLAERAMTLAQSLEAADLPAAAVNALVHSETLRDLGSDRVAFRHDVLTDWAVGSLLSAHPALIDGLPLTRPAAGTLARGVELAARYALERTADPSAWQSLLERVSRDGIHGSWRRAVLLALVRSEAAPDVLPKALPVLFADRARLLRELIRIVKAVEVTPAADLLVAAGIDASFIPPHLQTPRGPSWLRLILWLLSLGERLPASAIPEVADFYADWSFAAFGVDPVTPYLLPSLHRWLTGIEAARDYDHHGTAPPFVRQIEGVNLRDLESSLRTGFVLFCNRTPALAADYLRSVMRRPRNEDAVKAILRFRGQLAEAAPGELAELTASALIPQRDEDRRGLSYGGDAFTWTDSDFIPASPSQGPFLELLTHAAPQGLTLIRRLVDHAIAFHSAGRPHGANAFVVQLPEGPRTFAWRQSYNWSRRGGRSFAVASALMALEAWAHQRIEGHESFEGVLNDVLGTGDAPAAYVLVAVDSLLSHWPASRDVAVPFVACPELLCYDRHRWSHDVTPVPAALRPAEPPSEPRGTVMRASLDARPSRRATLDDLLPKYAFDAPQEVLERLDALLRDAVERLGPYGEDADLDDPALMAVHARNLLDKSNYSEVEAPLQDGRTVRAQQYVAPETERRHFERLQQARSDHSNAVAIQLAISAALDDRRRSSPEFAEHAAQWAQSAPPPQELDGEDPSELREHVTVGAAMILMRDGTSQSRQRHRDWAYATFINALLTNDEPGYRVREGLRYNPPAIAFAGMTYALIDGVTADRVRDLLSAVTHPGTARGFIAAAQALAAFDDRLPRAILRCAFIACIRPIRRRDEPQHEREARMEVHRQSLASAVEAESGWLFAGRAEPFWPVPPANKPRLRQRVAAVAPAHRPASDTDDIETALDIFDYEAAALWLQGASRLLDSGEVSWLQDVVRSYADWTWLANGTGLDPGEEISLKPHEWNEVYLALLARALVGADDTTVGQHALAPLASLPDEAFFDAVTRFLRSTDQVFFENRGLDPRTAVQIRSRLADRLRMSNGWIWLVRRRDSSVEVHLGPAIATFFFNDYGLPAPAKAYLLPPGIDRLLPFLPTLETLAVEGASHFVALVTLNLLEVSPRAAHCPFLLSAASAWIAAFPHAIDFWVDYAIGRRVCALLDAARREQPQLLAAEPLRSRLEGLLPALTVLGVPEAARLEEALK